MNNARFKFRFSNPKCVNFTRFGVGISANDSIKRGVWIFKEALFDRNTPTAVKHILLVIKLVYLNASLSLPLNLITIITAFILFNTNSVTLPSFDTSLIIPRIVIMGFLIKGSEVEALDVGATWLWQDAKIVEIIDQHNVRVQWNYSSQWRFSNLHLKDLRRDTEWPIRAKNTGVQEFGSRHRRIAGNKNHKYKVRPREYIQLFSIMIYAFYGCV